MLTEKHRREHSSTFATEQASALGLSPLAPKTAHFPSKAKQVIHTFDSGPSHVDTRDPDLQMPPKGKGLNSEELADLTQWVKVGALDPHETAGASRGRLELAKARLTNRQKSSRDFAMSRRHLLSVSRLPMSAALVSAADSRCQGTRLVSITNYTASKDFQNPIAGRLE